MITSSELRKQFRVLDTGFFRKVSNTALLRDQRYSVITPNKFSNDFDDARVMLAKIFKIDVLSYVYKPEIFDCDDMALSVCALMRINERMNGGTDDAYPVFPCALAENHTIMICSTTKGLFFGEPQTGELWSIDQHKPNVIFIG